MRAQTLSPRVTQPTPVYAETALDAGEDCDDGNTTTETCDYGETACTVCDAQCQIIDGQVAYCGDGNIEDGVRPAMITMPKPKPAIMAKRPVSSAMPAVRASRSTVATAATVSFKKASKSVMMETKKTAIIAPRIAPRHLPSVETAFSKAMSSVMMAMRAILMPVSMTAPQPHAETALPTKDSKRATMATTQTMTRVSTTVPSHAVVIISSRPIVRPATTAIR